MLIDLNPDDPPRDLAKVNGTLNSLVTAIMLDKEGREPTVRVCENFACGLPIHDAKELKLPAIQ